MSDEPNQNPAKQPAAQESDSVAADVVELTEGSAVISEADEPPAKSVKIKATVVAKLNLADHQNSVPVIRELRVINETENKFGQLTLTLTAEPSIFKPKTWHIDALGAGVFLQIPGLDVAVDGTLLTRLTEAENATLSFVLCSVSDGAAPQEVARQEVTLEMLPRNHWGGLSHLPEMTAAFVQPNDKAVEHLLRSAADLLEKSGKSSSLNGYASGAQHAWDITSAIWSTVSKMGLHYALPPASFEREGQKVRSPSQIVDSGLATCMDSSLLFCAALEQAGLNPLIVFTEGHAFAGVWLKKEEFTSSTIEDVTSLRKRMKLDELKLFETTLVTQSEPVSLNFAIERAAQQVSEEESSKFEMAIDIRRARMQRIKPLASAEANVATLERTEQAPAVRAELGIELATALPSEIPSEIDVASIDPKDRLGRWQRKLLDLSLRNNLLNFKAAKKALKFEAPDPGALEDVLSTGKQIKLMARPDLMDGADPRAKEIYELREHEDVRKKFAADALARGEVHIAHSQAELDSRLVELFRGARANLEEGGANTLFLAVGFLSWSPADRDGVKYKAPLIMIPVKLERRSIRSGFTLSLHSDEPRFNPTLVELLRQDFGLNLGVADTELPRDDAGLDVHAIWRGVANAVKDIKGWEVAEDVVLSMFSFAKYLMWKDLTDRSEALRQNPVVQHLLDSPRDAYTAGTDVAFPEERTLDEDYSPKQVFCPLPYDSSQLSAVLAARQGKDFVLIGPPGTGKSQTIVNIIAQSLAENKRVLFVSEKIAALNVVHRRLQEVGLGEFCLEVHSNKASKTDVLAQLNSAWLARGTADPESWRIEAERLEDIRRGLNVYVDKLHQRYPNGLSIYNAIGATLAGEGLPLVNLSWSSPSLHDREALLKLQDLSKRLDVNAEAVGYDGLLNHPLKAISNTDWSPSWQMKVVELASQALPTIDAAIHAAESFIKAGSFPAIPLTEHGRQGLARLAEILPGAAGQDWRFALSPRGRQISERIQQGCQLLAAHSKLNTLLPDFWPRALVMDAQRALDLLKQHQVLRSQLPEVWPVSSTVALNRALTLFSDARKLEDALSTPYSERVEELDIAALAAQWEEADGAFWPKSALSKRKITKQLAAVAEDKSKLDAKADLDRWAAIRTIRAEIDGLAISQVVVSFWRGAKTAPVAVISQALELQKAITAYIATRQWVDEGFDLIDSGAGGESLRKALATLRECAKLEREVKALSDSLAEGAKGVWSGMDTPVDVLAAAIAFQEERRAVAESGALELPHDLVASGACGKSFQGQHAALVKRAQVEQQLRTYDDLRQDAPGVWAGLHTKPDIAEKAVAFQHQLTSAIASMVSTPEEIGAIKSALEPLLGDANTLLEPGGLLSESGVRYLRSLRELQQAMEAVSSVGHYAPESIDLLAQLELAEQRKHCESLIAAKDSLNAWSAWRKARNESISAGLKPLVDALESGVVVPGTVRKVFEANYARWWLNATVDSEATIREFVSAEHEQRIRDFRELDERFTALTRDLLRARLCAELPQQETVKNASEWGVLRHEISKKTRHKPLRELMSSIPQAMTLLTPCMLMSPLSIAQYLPTDAALFDLVVFDEASQIPVWDAIGAIARGKQVVMVGDPKQMPPTSFFDRAGSADDNDEVEEDLESILDECLSANLPTLNLNWHYRSRHESLIAFSNSRYYDNKLVTFPSPVTCDTAVSFHYVPGVYERGASRTNLIEAKALIRDLVVRAKDEIRIGGTKTFGVVTFNSEQQRLIEDLLDAERRNDPELDGYFADQQYEEVFVKNLESVQGDERDIIYFSNTFGKDAAGNRLTMNFGPMTASGGERRLNVAVTRARHEMRVFASFKPEEIDLARTQSLAVRDMKHFLEFAERGPRAILESDTGSLGGFDSLFEEQVAQALGARGWQVATQIGVSTFRIDLAVVDPDAPGRYLAGVECDGATYHRSATARDRDMLREQVLRGLGWEILRVWSTDWWTNPRGVADKLHQRLEVLLEQARAQRAEADSSNEQDVVEISAAPAVESASEGFVGGEQPEGPPVQYARADLPERQSITPLAPVSYRKSDPLDAVASPEPDAFYSKHYDEVLGAMVSHVIHHEGPIRDEVLAQRIARAHGWVRTGNRIKSRVSEMATQAHRHTVDDAGSFFWPAHIEHEGAVRFRRPDDAEDFRPVDDISVKELEALARYLVEHGMRGDELIYGMAKEIGLQKVSAQSRARLELAASGVQSI